INGFTVPLSLSPRSVWDFASHPRWSLDTLRHGVPTLKNFSAYSAAGGGGVAALSTWINRELDPGLDWDDMAAIRDEWKGKLLIKGVMTPEDALEAQRIGADGIIVSNHGGRQLDGAPSSIRALHAISSQLRGELPLFLDSGIRRGSDVVKALCLGATAVCVGRATLYGAAAGGQAGIARTLDVINEEIDRTLALIGVDSLDGLDRSFLEMPTQ
nr:alpha-hydroxy-acid oxidizing protein [Gammaproteobacteria bacterium]